MGFLQRLDARLTKRALAELQPQRGRQLIGGQVAFLGDTSLPFPTLTQTLHGNEESIDPTFIGYAYAGYQGNPIVFACMQARFMLFAEARFQFRRLQSGRPGELFGTPALRRLERPWAGGTTGDLLARMMVSADLAGNAFVVATTTGARVLRPDWVTMLMGSDRNPAATAADVDAEVIALLYHPGGKQMNKEPEVFLRGEFAHFAPIPDPVSPFRGMPWIAPVVREVQGDTGYTTHKLQFLKNGATPNMVVTLDPAITQAAYESWVDAFEKRLPGIANAYKTLYLGGGAEAKPVGSDLVQMDFKAVQGAGETRIAAAAGVPPVVVGFSEGLQGSSLNAGNYTAARRRFADLTMRPLWRNAAGSLSAIVDVPAGSELWYDDRDIAFLQEDMQDAADIQQKDALTMRALIDAGFEPDTVVDAITAGDLKRLSGKHSGLYSVQLQAPGTAQTPPARAITEMLAPYLLRSDQPAPEVHVHQPDLARIMGGLDAFVRATDERAQAAERRSSEAIEAATRALQALAERENPVVNVTVPEQVPAPITFSPEVRVDVPVQQPPVVSLTVPEVQTVHIASLPKLDARIKRDQAGRITGITE